MGRTIARPAGEVGHWNTGQRLSWLMADRNVTSQDLAASVRIQESTLANFRNGCRNIPSDVVASMARELGSNVAYLLERSEDPGPEPLILEEPSAAPASHPLGTR